MQKRIVLFLIISTMAAAMAGVLGTDNHVQAGRLVNDVPSPPIIQAESAAVIDVTSGRLVYAKEADKRMRIASLTKIMTAIVAIENDNLNDTVTVGPNAYGVEGSSIYLRQGEEIKLEDLLYGLMLRSGNDAAVAIAEHVGGSVEGFTWMMNKTAEELGLSGTHFANPHGLDNQEHYSTARDMAVLTAYALGNETFHRIVATKVKKVPDPEQPWNRTWLNKNKMLRMYEGADGVKTGYTKLSGRCLVSSATRDGRQVAVVTLNDPDDWRDHQRLLDYAFLQFPLVTLARSSDRPGEYVTKEGFRIPVRPLHDFRYPLSEEEEPRIEKKLIWHDKTPKPKRLIEKGEGLGLLQITLDGQVIGEVPLIARRVQ